MRPFNLNVVVVAFAAGAGITAGAANSNFFELAVASLIIMSASAYVTSDIAIKVFHLLSPPKLLCVKFERLFKVIDKCAH